MHFVKPTERSGNFDFFGTVAILGTGGVILNTHCSQSEPSSSGLEVLGAVDASYGLVSSTYILPVNLREC